MSYLHLYLCANYRQTCKSAGWAFLWTGVFGPVLKASVRDEETVVVTWDSGADKRQPSAKEECLKEFVSRVGVLQALEGWQIATDNLLSLPSSWAVAAAYQKVMGVEDGLSDACVEVHHHPPGQVECIQLPQEVHSFKRVSWFSFLGNDGA